MYDYLVAGAGIYGATFARCMADAGKKVLVVDQRRNVGGMIHDRLIAGINVHLYGPHVFHTHDRSVVEFLKRFTEWYPYRHRVRVKHDNRVYSFPVNLETFQQLFGITTPQEACRYIEENRIATEAPGNFEDYLLSKVGRRIYEVFYRDYTKKHWGKDPRELPVDYAKRIPIRMNYSDEYYHDPIVLLIPSHTRMIQRMLEGIDILLETPLATIGNWRRIAKRCLYTGPLDAYFGHELGRLDYIHVRFEHETVSSCRDYQGVSVMNHTDSTTAFTRLTEHRHLSTPECEPDNDKDTILTREYPGRSGEACYPVADAANRQRYDEYRRMLPKDVIPGGRLGLYRYIDMDDAILLARESAEKNLKPHEFEVN